LPSACVSLVSTHHHIPLFPPDRLAH
jgi:hypothetical protein